MPKSIVYLVTSNGEDGRGKESTIFASTSESERDTWHNNSKDKNWNRTVDRIIDMEVEKASTLSSINALQKLALGLKQQKFV